MSQFHPHSCLFVYESLIITTAKNILVLNEQTYKPSSCYSPYSPTLYNKPAPPIALPSPDLFSCPERVLAGEEKRRYCCCFPFPCSNLLFVNAALTPEPLGAGGIPQASGHNTCSVWESCSRQSSACFAKVALIKLWQSRGKV